MNPPEADASVRQHCADEGVDPVNALKTQPDNARALFDLGNLYWKRNETDSAIACFKRVTAIEPEFHPAYVNLVNLHDGRCNFREAFASCRRALMLAPADGFALYNMGLLYRHTGEIEASSMALGRFLYLEPEQPEAEFELAQNLLMQKNFRAGFALYHRRFSAFNYSGNNFALPFWKGEDLKGKTLFVHSEQGLGDVLQFVRFIPLVEKNGGRIVFGVHEALFELLSALEGADEFVLPGGKVPDHDFQCPLMSLPHILGLTYDSIPKNVPYIRSKTSLREEYRKRLEGFPGFRVGICWRGNPAFRLDHYRSPGIRFFEPLLDLPGVNFVSLQKDDRKELQGSGNGRRVIELKPEGRSWDDNAAIMDCLDMVISSDTAMAHLAGAMGQNVWLVIPANADWRWFQEVDVSPWYPGMRIFRQRTLGDWQEVFTRVRDALVAVSGKK